jgi:subtilisin family serine protease
LLLLTQIKITQAFPSGTVKLILLHLVWEFSAWRGTSMATLHVSGVAALVWSAIPYATNVEVRDALNATAEDLGVPGRDDRYGAGLVQGNKALALVYLTSTDEPCGGGNIPLKYLFCIWQNLVYLYV